MSATYYQVFLTPLISAGVYGPEIDISDRVLADSLSAISRSIDSTDYNIGIFTFSDVTIVCDSSDGFLNDQSDSRSIFAYNRDLAKVRIVYTNGNSMTTFLGFINEEGSTTNAEDDSVSLLIFSHDSVLRKNKVPLGGIPSGSSFQNAIIAAVNSSGVSPYLSVNFLNINPSFNGTVDDGSKFDNKQVDQVLDELLLAANSVMALDSVDNVYVKSRKETTNPVLFLYGKADTQGRENIIGIANYNTGLQRTFNSFRVTGGQPQTTVSGQAVSQPAPVVEVNDAASIALYGLRQKQVTLDFLTTTASITAVANALLAEFRYPKIELEVTVPTELVQAQSPPTDLLDRVCVTYPLRVTPSTKFLPIIGITKIGDATAALPYTSGAVSIDQSLAFKVIEINENPQDFTTTLKLRQVGTSSTDGVFGWLETEDGRILQTESGLDIQT